MKMFRIFSVSLLLLCAVAFAREVPVRYVLLNDAAEHDAKFVKIAKDTVYLLPLDSSEVAEIQKQDEALLNQLDPNAAAEDSLAEEKEPVQEE